MIYCAIKNSFITWPMHFIGAFTLELAEVVIENMISQLFLEGKMYAGRLVSY